MSHIMQILLLVLFGTVLIPYLAVAEEEDQYYEDDLFEDDFEPEGKATPDSQLMGLESDFNKLWHAPYGF